MLQLPGDFEVCAEEGGAELGDQFLECVGLGAPGAVAISVRRINPRDTALRGRRRRLAR